MSELKGKIQNSSGYSSLVSERKVAKIFHELGWDSFQGAFYEDTILDKTREIDVIAQKNWKKKIAEDENIYVRLKLIIEVKSLSGYHILLSGKNKAPTNFSPNEYWIGHDEKLASIMFDKMNELNIEHNTINNFLNELHDCCYPDGFMKTSDLRIQPFPMDHIFTAYSETNIGSTKELENSVLWRALRTLKSVIGSMKNLRIDYTLEDFLVDIKLALQHEYDVIERGIASLNNKTGYIELYHPIVVIDSMLWSTLPKEPKKINSFRFYQLSTVGHIKWWADVVNSNDFNDFSKSVSEYYNTIFAQTTETEEA